MSPENGGERRTATVTVLFCDLVASTERHQIHGDDAADEFRREFFATLQRAARASNGETVKNTGDGLMVVFRDSTVDAVTCAMDMHRMVEELDVDPPAFLRIGISAGEAADEDGDWFGTPVIEAARLCAAATTGQTLVGDVVRVLVGSRGGHSFRPAGARTLKGLAAPLATATVVRAPIVTPPPPRRRVDPRRRWLAAIAAALTIVAISAVVFALLPHDRNKETRALASTIGYTPRVEAGPCNPVARESVPNVKCGVLVVPENRQKLNGRWVRLEYDEFPARHPKPGAEPVIALPVELAATSLDAGFDDPVDSVLRTEHPYITLAARGLDRSVPKLTCPEFAPVGLQVLARPQNDPSVVAAGERALRQCHDRLLKAGVALDHYTTLDQACYPKPKPTPNVLSFDGVVGVADVQGTGLRACSHKWAESPTACSRTAVRRHPRSTSGRHEEGTHDSPPGAGDLYEAMTSERGTVPGGTCGEHSSIRA